jgi:tuftelin-interacting protein 11
VHNPDQLIAVLDAWSPLLPPFVRSQLLQAVIRKLDDALQKWQPKKHTAHNLPHRWIFPWLPYLPPAQLDPKSATGLVADVRRKFRHLIDAWDFARGVIPGLKQWKDVLRPAATDAGTARGRDVWTPLVMNHLLPGLARFVRGSFKVDPRDQEPYMAVLDRLFEWVGVLRAGVVGEVVVAEVFPLWHAALYRWLVLEEANYEEIGMWFEWWREEVFPEEIRGLESVGAEFHKGAAMIERALDLGDRAARELEPPEAGPALKSRGEERKKRREEAAVPEVAAPPVAKKQEEVSFRAVMEEWCQNHDLQFMPERIKVHAEGPLYRISGPDGKRGVLVYFKGNSLFAQVKDRNAPIEIQRDNEDDWGMLIELAS